MRRGRSGFSPPSSCKARVSLSPQRTSCTVPGLSETLVVNQLRASVHRLPYLKDKPRGGAETRVWQTLQADPCRRQSSLFVTRSLIGPASRPIRSRRGLRKTPPRTRAVCTQDGEAEQSCSASSAAHRITTYRAVCIYNTTIRPAMALKRYCSLTWLNNMNISWCSVLWRSGARRFVSDERRSSHMFTRGATPHLPAASIHILQ